MYNLAALGSSSQLLPRDPLFSSEGLLTAESYMYQSQLA
jgi:hypothetical protein